MASLPQKAQAFLPRDSLFDRLIDKFLVGDGCWEWIGNKYGGGYGRVRNAGTHQRAHRLVYELLRGPIPAGYGLHHNCKNKWCVRPGPEHCMPVTAATHADNAQALRRAKTHCPQGHEYSPANTYVWHGDRHCRACKRERERERERARAQRCHDGQGGE